MAPQTGFDNPHNGLLIVWTWLLKVFSWQQSLETDVMRVAVDWHFVGAGLDLLWLLWGEWIGSTVSDVHLQLEEDLQGVFELHITVGTEREKERAKEPINEVYYILLSSWETVRSLILTSTHKITVWQKW